MKPCRTIYLSDDSWDNLQLIADRSELSISNWIQQAIDTAVFAAPTEQRVPSPEPEAPAEPEQPQLDATSTDRKTCNTCRISRDVSFFQPIKKRLDGTIARRHKCFICYKNEAIIPGPKYSSAELRKYLIANTVAPKTKDEMPVFYSIVKHIKTEKARNNRCGLPSTVYVSATVADALVAECNAGVSAIEIYGAKVVVKAELTDTMLFDW